MDLKTVAIKLHLNTYYHNNRVYIFQIFCNFLQIYFFLEVGSDADIFRKPDPVHADPLLILYLLQWELKSLPLFFGGITSKAATLPPKYPL